ncbi:MAG: CRISPR-associated endonuclease Cas1 [Cyanobacteria bacterium MAG IRC4_bin_6]|nr:CRISPR-associated endonuclease Cas1 [Cyanobacteria bacterium MAG IRC4_bin_6]
MRYLNTVYVRNHRARVQCRRGSLLVSSPEGGQRIPIEAIDALVVLGGAQITMQAIDACVQRGVRVAALKRGGAVRFTVNAATGGNVHLRSALFQAAMDPSRSLDLSRAVVAAKLQNSGIVVSRWARDEKSPEKSDCLAERSEMIQARIARLVEAETSDHVRGIEGDAARIYFRAVSEVLASSLLPFTTRTRRPPRDPINAMLGFCYGLLVTECVGALESVGLDHQMGFFHRPRSGRPSLALDLAEEFRALTDRFVVSLVRRRQIYPDSFEQTPGGGVYLGDDARTQLLTAWEEHKEAEIQHRLLGRPVGRWALPSVQSTLLARHLRGDLPAYPPFVLP